MANIASNDDIIRFALVKTNRRLTFDITFQREDTRYRGADDGPYFFFEASNGYQVISRSRMDIQTERLWLLGAKENERSGSMVFSSNEKRDAACEQFIVAIDEWCACVRAGRFRPVTAGGARGKCGDCKFSEELFSADGEVGTPYYSAGRHLCHYPIRLLPLSYQGTAGREKESIDPERTDCPTWSKKEEASCPPQL